MGTSLQDSIIAAYNYSEELDRLILDISINNSQANASLAAVQPVLSFVNSTSALRTEGQIGQTSSSEIDMGDFYVRGTEQHCAGGKLAFV